MSPVAKTDRIMQIRVGPFRTNAIVLPSAVHSKSPTYLVLNINVSLHSDNGLYTDYVHPLPLVSSHAAHASPNYIYRSCALTIVVTCDLTIVKPLLLVCVE